MDLKQIPPLHTLRVDRIRATINRAHIFVHSLVLLALLYYRASWLFFFLTSHTHSWVLTLTWFVLLTSELTLSFIWLLGSAYRWRPVYRAAFPERLSNDHQLPVIDVFICTADPEKEPPLHVMNTVLSAMTLNYPAEKLWVYLSDDGGAAITLYAMRQAFSFAKVWLPFCRKYGVQTTCPNAYFSEEDGQIRNAEFLSEREKMKSMYEAFKEQVERAEDMGLAKQDGASLIEVIGQKGLEDQDKMPHLVYVRREKRPTHSHNFKAGALNVLLRVSGLLSNGSYILVLDCDMYSNDPTSAKAAMCFHLDPTLSPTLAFVQFSQIFHNISPNDIYGCQLRDVFKIWWYGCDGLNGPILSGSGFYMKREALYGIAPGLDLPKDLIQRRQWFGNSNELLKTLRPDYKCNAENGVQSNGLLQEAHFLASCSYETGTKWGKQVGFFYDSVVEDIMTGIRLHCRGWNSVYYNPPRPQFLGSAPINLNDVLVQYKRWSSGLLEIAFSRYSPLPYGIMSGHSILHTMCLSYSASMPFYCVFGLCYATVPQLCLLNGISLYPKVSDPWFAIFLAVFISGSCQHLFEVLHTGGSFRMWWNEQRIWMVKSISANFFGCLDIATRMIGVKRVDFGLTSKVIEKDQVDRYSNEVFDFQGASLILVPVVTSSMLNMAALIGGVWRVIAEGNYSELMMTHESGSNATPETGGAEADAPNINDGAIDGAKGKRKDMEPRAAAWNHFTKLKGVDGRTRGKCKGCGRVFLADSKSNGTSSLNYHMSRCKHIKKVEGTSQSQLSFTNASGGECEGERMGTLGSWKFEQQASRNKLAKMVVIDELPFKYVENAGFREFVASLQPRFRVPSRWTVARDCYDLFIDEKAKLKTFIKCSCDRVCLTTDTWTSLQRINYMCLTVHFIDKEWKLHKKILSFRPIDSHKGDSIARAIERCLVEWGISNVFTITVDNASSNDQAMKNLQKKMANKDGSILKAGYLHMRCMAHIINLIVQDGLKDMNRSIERVRGAIKYVRHSPSRIARFRECIEMEKIECKKFLCLDVSTRWNSTYLMLESAQRFIPAFERYVDLDQMYATELQAGKGVPENDDWEKVKKFVVFLKHFYDLTLRISGTSYVTSNQIFNDISSVHCLLDQWKNSLDLEISLMGSAMKLKFDKYWGDFGKMNMVIYIAVALDPRFKMEYVEYVLKTMQPGQVGDKMVNDVRAATSDMLADYQKKFSSSSGQSVDKSQALNTPAQEEAGESFTNVYLSSFKRFRSEIKDENRTELDKYLSEGIEDATADFDILGWWKLSTSRYPVLSQMARDVLAIPASTVASESAFSAGGRVLDPYRTSLTPRMVQALICTKDWLTGEPICSYLEEDTEAIEKLEEDLSKLGLETDINDV